MVEISELENALRKSWSKETSSDPNKWSEENIAWGQCAVTALVVQDYLQGEVVWAPARLPDGKEISHYFNLTRGNELDFTREQFPEGTTIPEGIPKPKEFSSTREYVLSYSPTEERYKILKEKVKENLT